jgi:AraC family transcriptional regulator
MRVMRMAEAKTIRYPAGSCLLRAAQFPNLYAEYWQLAAGRFNPSTFESNIVGFVTSGRTFVTRTANGITQATYIQCGSAGICPIDVREDNVRTTDPITAFYIHLPRLLVQRCALEDYDVNPSKIELAYVGGLTDPLLYQLGMAVSGMMGCEEEPSSRLFVDGIQSALAAHLLSHYTVDRWRPPTATPELDPKRLKRVLDLIEGRFAEPLSLSELAAQACLSEFHFSRLFRSATGLTPYRFLTRRRVQEAQKLLNDSQESLLEIALAVGFGSQANFIRMFRQLTGTTPSQCRAQGRELKVQRQ